MFGRAILLPLEDTVTPRKVKLESACSGWEWPSEGTQRDAFVSRSTHSDFFRGMSVRVNCDLINHVITQEPKAMHDALLAPEYFRREIGQKRIG